MSWIEPNFGIFFSQLVQNYPSLSELEFSSFSIEFEFGLFIKRVSINETNLYKQLTRAQIIYYTWA